jgi:hypothetical protein
VGKREREREERKQRVVGHEEIVGRVSALLFAADPVGINFDDNTDEYDLEAEMIVIRLLDGVLQSELQGPSTRPSSIASAPRSRSSGRQVDTRRSQTRSGTRGVSTAQ